MRFTSSLLPPSVLLTNLIDCQIPLRPTGLPLSIPLYLSPGPVTSPPASLSHQFICHTTGWIEFLNVA